MGGAPRIPGFSYIGPYAYFLTICTPDRIPWFANHETARSVASQLSQNATDYGFDVVAYCVMPDHLHPLVEGIRADSNLRKFVAMFKQRSSCTHASKFCTRLWQHGYFDRVVREDEGLEAASAYIVANPLRAGICDTFGAYPFLGSSRYSIDQLREAIQASTRP